MDVKKFNQVNFSSLNMHMHHNIFILIKIIMHVDWLFYYILKIFSFIYLFSLQASFGRTDEEIAAEMLANHLRCNSSFIHDLFQGQIRSSLCCLGCGRFSNTFDPYLCISVPIPQYQTSHIFLYLVYFRSNLKMVSPCVFFSRVLDFFICDILLKAIIKWMKVLFSLMKFC